MANEYMVNASDILSIANAIREKGGTTEGLAFPDDFVSSIQAIQSGSGLNFTVVGGTTQPENPTENTIWVNTDIEIGKWTVSPNFPVNPEIGDVWVEYEMGTVELDVIDENSLIITFGTVHQYVDSGWVTLIAHLYKDSAWTEIESDYYLFDSSRGFNVEFNGWSQKNVTPNIGDTTLSITGTSQDSSDFVLYTKDPIDVTGYNTIELVLSFTYVLGYGKYASFGLAEYINETSRSQTYASSKTLQYNSSSPVAGETCHLYLDISSLSGNYHFAISGFASRFVVQQIYLRKEALS